VRRIAEFVFVLCVCYFALDSLYLFIHFTPPQGFRSELRGVLQHYLSPGGEVTIACGYEDSVKITVYLGIQPSSIADRPVFGFGMAGYRVDRRTVEGNYSRRAVATVSNGYARVQVEGVHDTGYVGIAGPLEEPKKLVVINPSKAWVEVTQ